MGIPTVMRYYHKKISAKANNFTVIQLNSLKKCPQYHTKLNYK